MHGYDCGIKGGIFLEIKRYATSNTKEIVLKRIYKNSFEILIDVYMKYKLHLQIYNSYKKKYNNYVVKLL